MLLVSLSLCCLVSLSAGTCLKENASGGIKQHPKYVLIQPGGTVNISCVAEPTKNLVGVHLRKRFDKILYVNSENKFKIYLSNMHLNVFGTVYNFTVTMSNVTESDTGFYLCDGLIENDEDICGAWTLLIVTADTLCDNSRNASDSSAKQGENLVLILLVVILVGLIPIVILAIHKIYQKVLQMKNQKQPLNAVYEDMRKTLRRNTMSNT
ncbi:hypothetical protein XELAEV_18046750mg [Xenopus laevis]|uniref:Immunoglobulin domain-containing protein n=1 Tax=Xenopus laevis TaxID=8355 RepID=A0A974BTI5_XENLA|nr:hypothetical protein XELAEV_18046750mg [Xenopus laevis]